MLRVRRRLELPQRTNLQSADALPGTGSQTPAAGRILEVRKTETTAPRGLLDVGELETHDRRQQAARLAGADILLRVHGVRVRQASTPGVIVLVVRPDGSI